MKDKSKTPNVTITKSSNHFPVVGIGASAGGLDAFKKLLKAIPENSGMAFVLVQHLDPKHESLLPELLQKVTNIPVLEISDDIKVQPNHIYIIPSNKMMVANDGVLLLSPRTNNKNERNLPVDIFFTSLAEVHQSHSIGVVLSGTASDGTKGLKAIKDHGGITFAQSEDSAAYDGMPHSAIQAGVVDFILPPEEIPQKLLEITKIIVGNEQEIENLPMQDAEAFKQILALLRIRKGTDFTYYKQTTISRRILRRMALNKNEELSAYLTYLRENKPEQDILYQDLLIPVTSFFRDAKSFDNLCETVFPQIIKNKKDREPIRVWVTACSTGQEVYSIAMCLKEILSDNGVTNAALRVQIFATDISEPAIVKARHGIYAKSETEGISEKRLQEFFTKTNGSYQVNKSLRDMCVFAVHSFLKDPPFGKMDFISCRNVLIYMEPYLQKKALTTFHYALNQKGFLLLGKSETISPVTELFATAAKGEKLFSRKDVPGKFMHLASQRSEQGFADMNVHTKTDFNKSGRTDFQKTADDIMLSKYTPAGVVVNEEMDIVHFRGKTGAYLEQLPGKPSHNLLKMAKNGLAFELRNILHKAKKDNAPVIKENIPVDIDGILRNISIEALPLPDTIEPHYLVLFHEASIGNKQLAISNKQSATGNKQSAKQKNDNKDLLIAQLEKELSQLREDMRSITEDQEAANEELQSANEELLSGSEELQSLNEELETGKEELQSTNEELTVVNQEMIGLNEQVTAARDYAEAVVTTVKEPLIVLDRNLRVQSANKSYYKTFQVNEAETEGKLIYELGNKQWNIPELRNLLQAILPEKESFFDYEVTHNFQSIGQRSMLLNAREIISGSGEEKLILLAIEDITERIKAQEILKESGEHFRKLVKELPLGIYSCDANGSINFYNDAAVKVWGRVPEIGKEDWCGSWKIINPDGSPVPLDCCPMAVSLKEGRAIVGEEIIIERPDGTRSFVKVYPQPQFGLSGEITGAINIVIDITEQKAAAKKIEQSEEQFRTLTQSLPQLIWTADKDGLINFFNQQWYDYTGSKPVQSFGNNWAQYIHPQHVEAVLTKWQHSMKTGETVTVELQLRARDGSYKWFYVMGNPVKDEAGNIYKWVGTITDIDERRIIEQKIKESEEHFRHMADLMPAKISNANPDGEMTYFNKQWLEFSGYSFEELKYFGYHKMMHPDEIEEFQQRLQKAAATSTVLEMEMRFLDKDGNYKWHLNLAAPIKDEGGNIKMWVGVTTEIQKIMQEGQRKSDFLKMVSHELKTPVTSIKGYVQFLSKMLSEEQETLLHPLPLRSSLKRIDSQVGRLTRLITEMLDLSRIEESRLELQKELFNLNDLVDEAVEDIRFSSPNHKINISHELRFSVISDRDRIGQVIINFITNAIKYSPGNDVIEVRVHEAENNQVAVSVKDDGIGIDKKDQEKIFERFYRVEGKNEQRYGGFGIGLFVAAEIIKRHEGYITVESEKGKGSVFTFTLPCE